MPVKVGLSTRKGVPVDRGWAWMILLGFFLNIFIILSVARSLGIIFVVLVDKYNESAASTAVLYVLFSCLGLLTAPLITALADAITVRYVCMIGGILCSVGTVVASFGTSLGSVIYPYGIISGLGSGFLLNPGPVILSRYFNRHLGMATGIGFAGSSIGGIVGPYCVNYILVNYGIESSLMLIGGFTLHTVVASALFRPISYWGPTSTHMPESNTNHMHVDIELEPMHSERCLANDSPSHGNRIRRNGKNHRNHESIEDEYAVNTTSKAQSFETKVGLWGRVCGKGEGKAFLDFSLLKDPSFVLFSVACLLSMAGFYLGLIVPAYSTFNLGYSKSDAAILLSVLGCSDLAGRLICGVLVDRPGIKERRIYSMAVFLFVGGIATFIVTLFNSYESQIVCLLIAPFCVGAVIAVHPVILADLVGADRYSSAWGFLLFFEGIGHMTSPVTIGRLFDVYGTYITGYYFVGSCMCVGSGFVVAAALCRKPCVAAGHHKTPGE